MAEQLASFPFRGRGRPTPHRWDEWLDGSVWRLTRGEDFDVEAPRLRAAALRAASRRGVKVRTSVDGDAVILQALVRREAA